MVGHSETIARCHLDEWSATRGSDAAKAALPEPYGIDPDGESGGFSPGRKSQLCRMILRFCTEGLGAKLLLGYVQVTDNFEGEIMAPVPVSDAR